jgi:stage V sporulation protein D (sporulation-specific penicillin-binding protein)
MYAMSSIPYGQQIACSALQLANAYSAVVNGGQLMQPHLVKCIVSPTGEIVKEFKPQVRRQPISAQTSEKMRELMGMVVTVGTGSKAKLGLYDVGGKTGTAQKYVSGGGVSGAYMSSFCGVAPIKNPKICVLVVINEPTRGGYYGGTVACPAVREIILKTLLYLKVEPDHPEAPLDEV